MTAEVNLVDLTGPENVADDPEILHKSIEMMVKGIQTWFDVAVEYHSRRHRLSLILHTSWLILDRAEVSTPTCMRRCSLWEGNLHLWSLGSLELWVTLNVTSMLASGGIETVETIRGKCPVRGTATVKL